MRFVIPLLAAALLSAGFAPGAKASEAAIGQAVAAAETQLGARVGVALIGADGGPLWSTGADARFPLNSTFKSFLCAALLAEARAGGIDRAERVRFAASDLVPYSPVMETRVGPEGATLDEACEATLRTSDNTAANLVLDALGGPEALTAYMRSIGDDTTRLDRREPALNDNAPGDPRDTSTPAAAAESLRALLLGDALEDADRAELTRWMEANAVAGPLLRSTLPAGWQIADRSGAGSNGSRSVIAAVWPTEGEPAVVAIYLAGTEASMDERNEAIARIGEAIFRHLAE